MYERHVAVRDSSSAGYICLSCQCWTVVVGRSIFYVYIPLVLCVCLGRFFGLFGCAVLVGSS